MKDLGRIARLTKQCIFNHVQNPARTPGRLYPLKHSPVGTGARYSGRVVSIERRDLGVEHPVEVGSENFIVFFIAGLVVQVE